eukprot:15454101-Alexandrium_andersonii.AAC.3
MWDAMVMRRKSLGSREPSSFSRKIALASVTCLGHSHPSSTNAYMAANMPAASSPMCARSPIDHPSGPCAEHGADFMACNTQRADMGGISQA